MQPLPVSAQPAERKIKQTRSICPVCLEAVLAAVFERGQEVWMDKECPQHGAFSALLSSDSRHYYESDNTAPASGSCCGGGCGVPATATGASAASTPWSNHSCTILIEIIERCNLACPTCFAGSSPAQSGLMSLEDFTAHVERLAAGGKLSSDMIQLSGGEPTIHPQFFEMIDLLFSRGFQKVCINSNGIKLAQSDFVERLAACRQANPGGELFVYLQFDGFDEATQTALRGRADLASIKSRALSNCLARDIRVHPVMTLTRGINDHEVGAFVQLAVDNPGLKNVVIQPAMYSGRYDNPRRQDRITLADTVNLICQQFGAFEPDDFMPIPCSDPNCFGMAVALRTADGVVPLSRYFPGYERWQEPGARELIDSLGDTINGPAAISSAIRWVLSGPVDEAFERLDDTEVDKLLELLADAQAASQEDNTAIWDRLLTISIKPFMDAWTYDQDRIDQCCVHILDPEGNPVSFCEFNAIHRPRQQGLQLRVAT